MTCNDCKHFTQFGPKTPWLRCEDLMGAWAELGKCDMHDRVESRKGTCDRWEAKS